MIYSGKFKVTSPFGRRVLNGKVEDHKGIDVVGSALKNPFFIVFKFLIFTLIRI